MRQSGELTRVETSFDILRDIPMLTISTSTSGLRDENWGRNCPTYEERT